MARVLSSFAAGLIFAGGLVVGGMTQPSKVVGFLDFFGSWDPSLVFVMGGAIVVHALLYRFVVKRESPVFAEAFQIPTRRDFNLPLILGAGLFGVGWGLGGYCPGPGLTALPTLGHEPLVFVGSMSAGMLGYKWLSGVKWRSGRAARVSTPPESPARRVSA